MFCKTGVLFYTYRLLAAMDITNARRCEKTSWLVWRKGGINVLTYCVKEGGINVLTYCVKERWYKRPDLLCEGKVV